MKLTDDERIKHKDIAEAFVSNKINAQEFLEKIN
jgi:hypothetical protein